LLTGSELVLTRNDASGPAINANGSTNPPLRFAIGGVESMRLVTTGLAIGTTAPDAGNRLQVQGPIAVPATSAGFFVNVSRAAGMLDLNGSGMIGFRAGGTDARMIILSGGQVGVNTPIANMSGGAILFQATGRSLFGNNSEMVAIALGYSPSVVPMWIGCNSSSQFAVSWAGGSGAALFTIDGSSGNVNVVSGRLGVNQASPGFPLDVNGMIRSSSGGYRFPDGTTQASAAVGGISSQAVLGQTFGISYQNGSSKPRFVQVSVNSTGAGSIVAKTDAGFPPGTTVVSVPVGGAGVNSTISFWVLPGNYYQLSGPGSVGVWTEWT
jgi:hypothetical protein